MKRLFLSLLCVVALTVAATAQSQRPQFGEQPKLVVGIVVDQMRWDYLSRYYDRFGSDGSIMSGGFELIRMMMRRRAAG